MPPTVLGVTVIGIVPGAAPPFCWVTGTTFWKMDGEALPARVERIESVSEVTINIAAAIVVAFDSTVAEPRGPNTVCDPMPPKAPAKSAALPLWSSTTTIKNIQIK